MHNMLNCLDCNFETTNEISFRRHQNKAHGLSSQEAYVKYKCDSTQPTCKCGCGEKTKFYTWNKGHAQYAPGHQSRINNPMSGKTHTHEVRQRLAELRRNVPSWNSGLTKDNDKRVLQYSQKCSIACKAKSEILSERMKRYRLDGTIPTLSGEQHSQWKGGASSVNALTRKKEEYRQWHKTIRENSQYHCVKCNIHESEVENSTLDVHHSEIRFATLVNSYIRQYNPQRIDNWELNNIIASKIAKHHTEKNIPGIAVCRTCHRQIHCDERKIKQ